MVEMLNGHTLNGRKIKINWALPINNYRFREQRNLALNIEEDVPKKRWKKKAERVEKKGTVMEVDEKDDEEEEDHSVAFKKIQKWKSKRNAIKKNKKPWTVDIIGDTNVKKTEGEKRGIKRKQTFSKPRTKKIKMTL